MWKKSTCWFQVNHLGSEESDSSDKQQQGEELNYSQKQT